jgi:hypothetical protein
VGRFVRVAFGPGKEADLTILHCLHSIGEGFFVVSLAGSIFFAVSPDAARPRVLLFLVLTLAPFLVMAPLVGPFVDRIRGGLVAAAAGSLLLRAGLALVLAENLRTLLLFPLAFGILVAAKTYTVARNGLVPAVAEDPDDLVAVNARLSRTATVVGGVGSLVAVAVFGLTAAPWTLRIAAVVYLIGAAFATRLRVAVRNRLTPAEPDVLLELARPEVAEAIWVMMVLRGAVGFALFQFGFSLRAGGAPVWVVGAVIVGNSLGAFVGTVVSPALRVRFSESTMFTICLVAPAIAAGGAALAFHTASLLAAIVVLGCAASVGRRTLDATIQRQAPDARLGQVYAGLETRLELAWVGAACAAVGMRVASWIGVLALAGFLVLVALFHLRRRGGMRIMHPVAVAPLEHRLLLRAEVLADHGFYDEAIVLAHVVQDQAGRAAPPPGTSSRETAQRAIEQARAEVYGAH